MPAHPALVAHSAQFPKLAKVLSGEVHVFVGYAASNVYVIEGADTLAVIDTTESTAAAEDILMELRGLTGKPVETIVYTHSHRDHISGASVFAEDGAPEIIAWHEFSSDIVGTLTGPGEALLDRTRKQFGFGLSFPDERVNIGCGPGDRPVRGMGAGHLPPTRLIREARTETQLAGRTVELIHAPGETPDHLMIWLADAGLLVSGDNFYHSFPNLYPIRGSAYRDFEAWADSLDLMLSLEPAILCPGHTLPVEGRDAIRERLADYRDAIRFVVDATAEALNAGRTPDEIATSLRLPAALAAKPWLKEHYGKLEWSVRAYAAGTLGWFDGNPTNLARLDPQNEAERMIALAGGAGPVLAAARDTDDPQWTLELCDRLVAAGVAGHEARQLKAEAMRKLADSEINATARNFYLVSARDLEMQSS